MKDYFEAQILNLQFLQEKYGVGYPEECQKQVNKIGRKIMEKNLLLKYNDIDFGKQLLLANEVPAKYWNLHIGSEVVLNKGISRGAICKVTKIDGCVLWLKSQSFFGRTHKFDIDNIDMKRQNPNNHE